MLDDAMWALDEGRHDEVERLIAAAEGHGQHTWDMSVVQVVGGMRLLSALAAHAATGVLLGWPGVHLGPEQRLVDLLPAAPSAG